PHVGDLFRNHNSNIAGIYDVGTHEGHVFVASELLDGVTLKRFTDDRPIPIYSLLSLSIEIAAALATAHWYGVAHRRLTPTCILGTAGKHAKIFHFGISGLLPLVVNETKVEGSAEKLDLSDESTQEEYSSEISAGAYKSPEQVRQQSVGVRSDVFSFGT